MEDDDKIVEGFQGVYLLYCENVRFKGRTYIGYTVDPVRRIKRHNAGKDFGGAKRTDNKGPWNMVIIIHGFPNPRMALRFEWAWQNPDLSRHSRHIPKKQSRESMFDYCLNVVSEMLQVPPWNRLPLSIRWLDEKFYDKYSTKLNNLPAHMPISCGKIEAKKIGWVQKQINKNDKKKKNNDDFLSNLSQRIRQECDICLEYINDDDKVTCVKENCKLVAHIICLSKKFRSDDKILPINGICPVCKELILWGDIVKKKIGCYINN
ncbi:structure-specific endonuclease subunit slx1 [Chelonus insularis]|uniref:structure-specific endonuclease subunit slx1 n=1 Tax=Chelonus insularis TaxID=460826 RepID=UPI00158B142A|nr:structure-specific endonuclease subunit slx1 [Chelonus insularis]